MCLGLTLQSQQRGIIQENTPLCSLPVAHGKESHCIIHIAMSQSHDRGVLTNKPLHKHNPWRFTKDLSHLFFPRVVILVLQMRTLGPWEIESPVTYHCWAHSIKTTQETWPPWFQVQRSFYSIPTDSEIIIKQDLWKTGGQKDNGWMTDVYRKFTCMFHDWSHTGPPPS